MFEPIKVLIKNNEVIVDLISQFYLDVESEELKFDTLLDLYTLVSTSQAIIFCNTIRKVEWLEQNLTQNNFKDIKTSCTQAEKQAKKEAAAEKKKAKQKEKENSLLSDGNADSKTSGQKTRGAKRQNELRSPEGDVRDTRQSVKRTRKATLTEADILNIIDEEELHKRVAQVGSHMSFKKYYIQKSCK